jgi:cupin 2 domain-containing protein
MSRHPRGRLAAPDAVPSEGERTVDLVAAAGFTVEQILSGRVSTQIDYVQDHDEWVVVLHGSALLEVDGEPFRLRAGDWVLLGAQVPHRLVRVEPGTSWIAVRSAGAPKTSR